MHISSAFLYGSGMSAGQVPTPVLPSNVIFDQGIFNMQRMKAGFALDNLLSAQDKYSGIPYWQGRSPIMQGGFTQEIQADDGTTFVNHGTDVALFDIIGGTFQHIGTSDNNSDADGCDYFLPVNFDTLAQEGYSKFCIDLEYSNQGIVEPSSSSKDIGVYVDYASSGRLNNIGGNNFSMASTSDFRQYTFEVDFGGSGLNYVPAYIEIRATHGTYNIYKMWFA